MNVYHKHIAFLLSFVCCVLLSCSRESVEPDTNRIPILRVSCNVAYDSLGRGKTPCRIEIQNTITPLSNNDAFIHLRGNSTADFPKRPLTMKLSVNQSVCGMSEAKNWVLLANYFDKTMLRNSVALKMAKDSRLSWTPNSRFVELYYNDELKGTYQICEKVQVHHSRLNLPLDGWLIEIDGRADIENDVCFFTPHMPTVWRIEYPKITVDDPIKDAIYSTVLQAEEALFGDDFMDQRNGWRKYLDEDSWVDWYLVNEIMKNYDGVFNSSCYVHSGIDGKLVMGPVWDFDISAGNINSRDDAREPTGWHIQKTNWYARLFEDTLFTAATRERFNFFNARRNEYYQFVRDNSTLLQTCVERNDSIWRTIGVKVGPNPIAYGSYEEEVDALIRWLEQRFEWMNDNL